MTIWEYYSTPAGNVKILMENYIKNMLATFPANNIHGEAATDRGSKALLWGEQEEPNHAEQRQGNRVSLQCGQAAILV